MPKRYAKIKKDNNCHIHPSSTQCGISFTLFLPHKQKNKTQMRLVCSGPSRARTLDPLIMSQML